MTLAHRLRRFGLAAALLVVAALAAAPVLAKDAPVSIAGKAFEPAEIDVAVGDTVTWTVTQSINEPHSVTSGKPTDANGGSIFDSGLDKLKDTNSTYTFTFESEGRYDYFCTVHPEMVGTVVVSAAGGGGEGHEARAPISPERKLLGGAILLVTLVVCFAGAWFWRRMNPA